MKKLLYLFLFLPVLLFAQPRYGVEGIPMCWTISGIDSNVTRYVLISSTGSPVQTIAWENAAGQVINVSAGYLRYGYCDCAGGGGAGGNGIYGGSGTLPNALVEVQNTQGIKFAQPGTPNGMQIVNKANGAAAIALDPTFTDSIRQGLVWKQGADSAAVGIDKDGRLQLLTNNWVTIGNDQVKIILTKDDALVLIKTATGVYGLPDGVPLSGKNNVMLWPNGASLGRFANLDSLVDGRLRKDTTVVVLSSNKVVDFDFADTRRYSNVYFVGKGVTDTAQLIFLNPPAPEQFGTVFHMKADSGGVAVRFAGSQGVNNKFFYMLRTGQRAEVRALYDAVAGLELWEVVVVWDSLGILEAKTIYTANDSIKNTYRKIAIAGTNVRQDFFMGYGPFQNGVSSWYQPGFSAQGYFHAPYQTGKNGLIAYDNASGTTIEITKFSAGATGGILSSNPNITSGALTGNSVLAFANPNITGNSRAYLTSYIAGREDYDPLTGYQISGDGRLNSAWAVTHYNQSLSKIPTSGLNRYKLFFGRDSTSNWGGLGTASANPSYLIPTFSVWQSYNNNTQKMEWLKITMPYNDFTSHAIRFYGKYAFANAVPSSTSGAKTLHAWTGDGSTTLPELLRFNHGVISTTTDASGDIIITIPTMPDNTYTANVTITGTTLYGLTVHTKTTTSFKVRFYNTTTAAALGSGVSVTFDYDVKNY